MSGTPDWGKLVAQGRAKAFGVAWSPEEAALLAKGVTPDALRQGKSKVPNQESKSAEVRGTQTTSPDNDIAKLTLPKLKALAKSHNLEVKSDATKAELIEAIKTAQTHE